MQHGNNTRLLAFRMEKKDIMMLTSCHPHLRIPFRKVPCADTPFSNPEKTSCQQARIAPLLPDAPLPQRVPGDLPASRPLRWASVHTGTCLVPGFVPDFFENLLHGFSDHLSAPGFLNARLQKRFQLVQGFFF